MSEGKTKSVAELYFYSYLITLKATKAKLKPSGLSIIWAADRIESLESALKRLGDETPFNVLNNHQLEMQDRENYANEALK